MESSVANLPPYRIPTTLLGSNNRPFNSSSFDIRGPIRLGNDVYAAISAKNKKKKRKKNIGMEQTLDLELPPPEELYVQAYILTITCNLTRYSFLEVIHNRSYLEVKGAFVRFVSQFGAPSLMVCDNESSFKAMSRDHLPEGSDLTQKLHTIG